MAVEFPGDLNCPQSCLRIFSQPCFFFRCPWPVSIFMLFPDVINGVRFVAHCPPFSIVKFTPFIIPNKGR
ncbi:MAG: hypothetical protein Q7S80_02200, partial [bacterium]|nr:hypothetical protein [bacterium]